MKLKVIFPFKVVLTYWTSVLHSRLGDGLGLFLDSGQLKVVNNDTVTEYQTSKIGGVQYDSQFTLGDSFSFLLLGTEFSGKDVLPDNTKY